MNTLELLSYLRTLDIQLTLNGDRLHVNSPKGALTPALRHQLQQRKAELLAFLQQAKQPSLTKQPITPISREQSLPLSFAQQRLWVLSQMESHQGAYNISDAWHITGTLNLAALGQAMTEIVSRHEILRTTFLMKEGLATQLIAEKRSDSPILSIVDFTLSEMPISKINKFMEEEAAFDFDLVKGPLIRVKLLRLGGTEHILQVTCHHMISDGWSTAIFVRELTTLYEAFSNVGAGLAPAPTPLPPLPVQYVDFAVWQRQWLQDEELDYHLDYWLNQLQNAPALLALPTDHPRPPLQTFNGEIERFELDAALSQKLKQMSQKAGATLFMTLLAAFKVLLYRYSGQEDIIVGTPIANRNHRQIESLMGFFVNTLALRTQLDDQPTFLALLERVRDVALDAYHHQDLPFEKLVEQLQPKRNSSFATIFQVMFIWQNSLQPLLALSGLIVKPLEIEYHTAKFDLTLEMAEVGSLIKGHFEYNCDLFERATIHRLVGHFITLLEHIVESPQQTISKLPLLSRTELQKVLHEWNNTAAPNPYEDKTIHKLFEEQVERSPAGCAVVYDGEILTYEELNRQANQVARYLQSLGVGPEVPVGISIEPSFEMVIGILGILKAGGLYVPLDPNYPKQRLAFMIEDAKVEFLLTQNERLNNLPEIASQKITICLDRDWDQIARHNPQNPKHKQTGNSGLYIIYTSGSTGKPKGVLGLHQGAINRLNWMWKHYPFELGEICCQKTTLNFVDSVWELFGPLLQGVPLVLMPETMLKEPRALINFLKTHRISRLVLVPSLLRIILDTQSDLQKQLPHLKYWTTSGESLPQALYQRFTKAMPEAILLNIYGSSEVSADATCYDSREGENGAFSSVPIGRPIDNTQLYILDRHFQPVPIGLPGELYIGGSGLARGYVGRPDLTAERFVANPFGPGLLYKSGDLGRYFANGEGQIEYLGRLDHQVKVRGQRVELGEVEKALSQHPAVREAVVVARDEKDEADKELVAYLVADLSTERVLWQSRAEVELPTGESLILPTSDLSTNGIGLQEVPVSLQVGQELRCALQLPSQLEPHWFKGRIAWRTSKAAGILFETTPEEKALLQKSIQERTAKQCGLVTDMRHRAPRVPFYTTCMVQQTDGPLLALTENLSIGGVRLKIESSTYKWQTGQNLQLQFQLPGNNKKLSLNAAVMWLNPKTKQIGLKFNASREESYLLSQTLDYLNSSQGLSLTHLRDELKLLLPEYMIPNHFVIMDNLPLTPNGKINRLALPAPNNEAIKIKQKYLPPRDELELQLCQIWQKIFNRAPIGIQDDFFELGGHSLKAITLFSEIEKITNRRLPLTALLTSPTIEQLTKKLRERGYKPSWSSLVPLHAGGSKPPFFLVAPFTVSVLSLNQLSHHMAPERPLYGLQPQGLDGKQAIHQTIEEMATHYITEIKNLQPQGPYIIGGHCAGSWVAFEMASQLKEQGEEISALIIIDAEPPNFEPPPTDLRYYLNRGLHYLQEGRFYHAFEWKLKQRLKGKWGKKELSEQEAYLEKVRATHRQAYDNYIAPLYTGPMLFLRSDEWNNFKDTTWHKNWELLTTDEVEFDTIPGAHSEMLNEPNVQVLAQKLKAYLDKREKSTSK